MPWLEYRTKDGYAVAIHAERPVAVPDGYALAESDYFQPGDEFTYYIVVNEAKDGRVTSHAAVRQAPPVQEILARTNLLEKAAARLTAFDDRLKVLEAKVK